ncbi:MAG: hypothetical protein KA419_13210 [Acidobacteria bacterium]|nr:hypothetical protein [Acidobacteriota bacterium]
MKRRTLLLLTLLTAGLFLWVRQGTPFPFLPEPRLPSLPPVPDKVWEETAKQLGREDFDPACGTLKLIHASAREGRRWGEAVRALVALRTAEAVRYRMGFAEQVCRLGRDAAAAPDGMRPLLRLVVLNWHQSRLLEVFQDQRRESPGRRFTGEDPLAWGPARFYRHVLRLQDELLRDEDLLKRQKTVDYLAFLGERNVDPRLLPTLFDVAASHLLAFHQSEFTVAAYPEDPVEVPADSDALGPVDRFLSFVPRVTDPSSPRFRALSLFQGLLRFHARGGNTEAVWNYDLQRLKYLRQTAEGSGLVARYLEQLRRLVAVSRGKIRQRASYCLGKELYDLGRYDESFRAARAGDPGSSKDRPGGCECLALRCRMLEPRCKLMVDHVCAADGPARFRVEHWNLERLHFRIYRDRSARRLKAIDTSLSFEEYQALLRRPPERAWSVDLPARRRVGPVRCEVETSALPPGPWLLFASTDPDFRGESGMPLRAEFQVSRFVLLSRDLGGTVDGYALDIGTGAPLAGVRIDAVTPQGAEAGRFPNPVVTDAGGYFAFPVLPPARPVSHGAGDRVGVLLHARATDGSELVQLQSCTVCRPRTLPRNVPRTLLFTDRGLYRPGQTVRFKGICVHADPVDGSYRVLPGRSVSVRLESGGSGPLATRSFRTNRFGSFSGGFDIPPHQAAGPLWLVSSDPAGEVRLALDADRPPTLRVELGPPGQTRLGETVTVPGRAVFLSGAPVAGASVRYRVFRLDPLLREPLRPHRLEKSDPGVEIARGEAKTDGSGSFRVLFRAVPDHRLQRKRLKFFLYRIIAEVTAGSGETRDGECRVRVERVGVAAAVAVDALQETGKPVRITVSLRDAGAEPVRAAGTLRVSLLRAPARPVPAELTDLPESFEPEFIGEERTAPDTLETADWTRWPSGPAVVSRRFSTGTDGVHAAAVALPPGVYRAEVRLKDAFDGPVTSRATFVVIDPAAARCAIPTPFLVAAGPLRVEAGQTFRAVCATGFDRGPLLVEVLRDHRRVRADWLDPGRTQHVVEYPVGAADRGGFHFRVTLVRDGRAYQVDRRVDVPWTDRKLDLRWERFRPDLQPGGAETWTLRIRRPAGASKDTEMLAVLCDASRDQWGGLPPHSLADPASLLRSEASSLAGGYSNFLDVSEFPGPKHHRGLPWERIACWLPGFGELRWIDPRAARPADVVYVPAAERPSASAGLPTRVVDPLGASGASAGEDDPFPAGLAPRTGREPLAAVPDRTVFGETAVFLPHLVPGPDGVVTIPLRMPRSHTLWRFLGLAHGPDLSSGLLEGTAVTAKPLMVQILPPGFLRVGDELEMTVSVTNAGSATLSGQLGFSHGCSGQAAPREVYPFAGTSRRPFTLRPGQTRTFAWRLRVPVGAAVLRCRARAIAGALSDGEERSIPVLPDRVDVLESAALCLDARAGRTVAWERTLSPTFQPVSLTVSGTSNPAWWAVRLIRFHDQPGKDPVEVLFQKAMAWQLTRGIPALGPHVRRWLGSASPPDRLSLHQDLKPCPLSRTPWVSDAALDARIARDLALLADKAALRVELRRRVDAARTPPPAKDWYARFPLAVDRLRAFGKLKQAGLPREAWEAAFPLIEGLDRDFTENCRQSPADAALETWDIDYAHARSFFLAEKPMEETAIAFLDRRLGGLPGRARHLAVYDETRLARLASALHRQGDSPRARAVLAHLVGRGVYQAGRGLTWPGFEECRASWVQPQLGDFAEVVGAMQEVGGFEREVVAARTWLLNVLRVQRLWQAEDSLDRAWALTRCGGDWLAPAPPLEVSHNGFRVPPGLPESGTGLFENRFEGAAVWARSELRLRNAGTFPAWAAVHRRYLECFNRLRPYGSEALSVRKSLFRDGAGGLVPLEGDVRVGEEVVVRIEVTADRFFSFVHLTDHGLAGFETVRTARGFGTWDGGPVRTSHDRGVHAFLDGVTRGTHVFEYRLRAVHRGRFTGGSAHVLSWWAPEFNAHTGGLSLSVR